MTEVGFYFDPGCPWAWLAAVRLQESAMRWGARIGWKPVLALRVDAAVGPSVPSTAERNYAARDLADWAAFCGVRILRPARQPAAVAARAIAASVRVGGRVGRYVDAIFAGGPGGDLDINDRGTLLEIGVASGFDHARLAAAFDDPASQADVERHSDELVALGGFGSATMRIGDRLYAGNARMPLVELALTRAGDHPLIIPGAHGQT